MRVAFLNPPFMPKFSRTSRSPAVAKSGTIYYPFWLAYAAGYVRKYGNIVDLIDAPAAGYEMDYILKRLSDFAPGLIIVETSTPSIYQDIVNADLLKSEFPDAVVILVGTHVTALPEECIELGKSFDGVALREFDNTILDLCKALDNGESISSVKGLALRTDNGVIKTELQPLMKNLDDIPFVAEVYKDFLTIEDYFFSAGLYPQVMTITGRGCPFGCKFCVYPQTFHGRGYRPRSAKNVVDEFQFVSEELPQVKEINIEDDTFTVDQKRVAEICQGLLDRKIKLSWTANVRSDLKLKTMKLMKAAGCRLIIVGYESGNAEILKNMNKGITIEHQLKFARNSRKAKMLVHGCFMIGNPGESRKTLQETLDLAIKLEPDTAQFFPLMVYPGTETYNWAKQRDMLVTNRFNEWNTPEGLHNTVIRTEDMSPQELVDFCDYARKKFYLRPKYIVKKAVQSLLSPPEMKRTMKSFGVFSKYLFARRK